MTAVRRLHSLFLVTLFAVVTSGCFLKLLWIDKGGMDDVDQAECTTIMTPVTSRFTFPPSQNPQVRPGRPAAYCGIEGRDVFFPTLYTRVAIYGIVDRSTQDAILQTVKAARGDAFKPVIVMFYEKEIWTTRVSPQTGLIVGVTHEIEQERQLRQETFR
jgi:hypothetical protein